VTVLRSIGVAGVAAVVTAIGCRSNDQMQAPQSPPNVVAAEDPSSLPPGYARGASRTVTDAGAAGDAAGLAAPGPTALACSTDDDCITHRCNGAYGRCAFPCVSDTDCIAGTYCYRTVVSACMPKESP
jgi:hypothetical protein